MKYLKTYESFSSDELIEESLKDWIKEIGAAGMLLISALMPNTAVGQNINKVSNMDIKPDKVTEYIQDINNIIKNRDNVFTISRYFGYKIPENQIIQRGERLISELEEVQSGLDAGSYKGNIETLHTNDPQKAKRLFNSGEWAITRMNIRTVLDTIYPKENLIPTKKIEMSGSSDDVFEFGKLTLKEDFKNNIKDQIENMLKSKIIPSNIYITTGTDMVRVTGDSLLKLGIRNNVDLATARANVIKDYISTLGIDTSMIGIATVPNNPKNLPGFKEDAELRIANVVIEGFYEEPTSPDKKIIINKRQVVDIDMVKVNKGSVSAKDAGMGKMNVEETDDVSTKTDIVKPPVKCPNNGKKYNFSNPEKN